MTKVGDLSLQVYVGDAVRLTLVQRMQVNNRQTRQPDTIGKLLEGPLTGPQAKSGPVIPSYSGKCVSPRKLKTPMSAVKSNTGLNDEFHVENESKNSVEQSKRIFWQTSINDQRPKLRVCINGIFIDGLLDTGADVSIITPEPWHPNWPLQEVDVQFLGIGTLSRVKQDGWNA